MSVIFMPLGALPNCVSAKRNKSTNVSRYEATVHGSVALHTGASTMPSQKHPEFDPGLTQSYTGHLRRAINKDGSFN